MAASVQFRPHERDLGMVMREVDENLAIFLGIKNIESKAFDEPKSERIEPCVQNNYFLDSEIDTNGYDWLTAQPVIDSAKNPTDDARVSESNAGEKSVWVEKRRPLSLSGDRKPTPRVSTPTGQPVIDSVKNPIEPDHACVSESNTGEKSVSVAKRRPLSLSSDRKPTPTGQPVIDSAKNPIEISRCEVDDGRVSEINAGEKSVSVAKRRPLSLSGERKTTPRASTPTGQQVIDSAKNPIELSHREGDDNSHVSESIAGEKTVSVGKRRPLSLSGDKKPTPKAPTPTGQRPVAKAKSSRASTPTPARAAAFPSSRTALATSSKPRSSTPGRKSTDAHTKTVASDPIKAGLAASGRSFQTVKSRPTKTAETQITKTSSSRRPASASRGRPSGADKSSTVGKPRQKSCSPAKTRVLNGNVGAKVRGCSNGSDDGDGDDVNPVAMGTKMVERVVNMRKLAPPKQDDIHCNEKKPSSQSNSGFGRSLSKKSLDMAIRHMGIKGSIRDGLSSSARGGHLKICKSSAVGAPNSPIASSSDSSKSSNGASSYFVDGRY